MYKIFNQSKFKERRKELRKTLTPQESKLWYKLKNNRLGVKFRRQHGIGPYIVDFYCKEKNLIVEIDGPIHLGSKGYDEERNDYMQTLGIKVLRFRNNEIDKNLKEVLKKTQEYCSPAKGSWRSAPEG